MRKTIFLTLVLVILFTSFSSAHEKKIYIKINEDGTSKEKIIWDIKVKDLFSYIPKSEWKIQTPKRIREVSVADNKQTLDYKINELPGKNNNELVFSNSKNIYYYSKYFFDIKYTEENNPIVFEPEYRYKKTFTSKDDEKLLLEITIPEKAQISYILSTPQKQEKNKLTYNFAEGETKEIEIRFEIPETETTYTTISSRHYEMTLPEKYSEEYILLLEESDKGADYLEEIYGFVSPHIWKIKIAEDFEKSEQIGGAYLGNGAITLQYNILQKSKEDIIELILHETAHGFNSKFFRDEVPNFWFEEGTAIYVSYESMDYLGYDTKKMREEKTNLALSCRKVKAIIPQWSPNRLLLSPPGEIEIECKDGTITNEISLGYSQSYHAIDELTKKYGKDLIKKFFESASAKKIQFSSNREELNSEVNYILTDAVGEDTTDFLHSLEIEIKKRTITGFLISENPENSKNLINLTIFLILIIIVIALIKKQCKKSPYS